MNRLKFRAWDKENNEMLYPDDTDKILFEINEYGITTYDVRYLDEYGSFASELDSVVMQSTELKDTNGEKIYEGDIVKLKNPFDKRFSTLGIIVWREDKACFGIDMEETTEQFELYRITTENYLTIIGNKFEDGCLLGED